MQFTRIMDVATHGFDTGFPGYRAQILSSLESCLTIFSEIQAGGCGPTLHTHHCDQIYYMLDGAMTVQLGSDVHDVSAGDLVYIPEGLPHRNWNPTIRHETHVEVLVPAPAPGAPLLTMVSDDAQTWPADLAAGWVMPTSSHDLTEALPGFFVQALVHNEPGARCVINYCEMAPGGKSPEMHVHEFDQYYVVLDGQLTVDVALHHHVVDAGTLVVLPAGVPHRQYNAGPDRERHLSLLTPAPAADQPWDRGVSFAANGEEHSFTPAVR